VFFFAGAQPVAEAIRIKIKKYFNILIDLDIHTAAN
jgi:hypothetical protein